jgi:SAM-dependent methyltransferase
MRYEFRGAFPAASCRDCGMRFLRVQPEGESLASLYSAEYFRSDFRCGRSDSAFDREDAFRGENLGLLDAFERLSKRARLLEIGCAAGWLLKHARERGWQVAGVEPSAAAADHARSLGLDVRTGTLHAAAFPDASFELAFMGDVLEHVPDCRATLEEVARVLVPGGHLFLRGPITTNSLGRGCALAVSGMLGRDLVLREPPYHLWEFTPGPLRRLFRASGFEVVSLRQSKIPPGRAHGRKSALQKLALGAFDTLNLPLTALFNVKGDRAVVIGRRAGLAGRN